MISDYVQPRLKETWIKLDSDKICVKLKEVNVTSVHSRNERHCKENYFPKYSIVCLIKILLIKWKPF